MSSIPSLSGTFKDKVFLLILFKIFIMYFDNIHPLLLPLTPPRFRLHLPLSPTLCLLLIAYQIQSVMAINSWVGSHPLKCG